MSDVLMKIDLITLVILIRVQVQWNQSKSHHYTQNLLPKGKINVIKALVLSSGSQSMSMCFSCL
jgi:hypothetical protein